jgi:hypothetical protein
VTTFTKLVLYTDRDGRAKFREERVPLDAGTPQTMVSAIFPSAGYQLRQSPVGFRSQFHCTPQPQWVFVLAGEMEIGLQDGTLRVLEPGDHCYAADVLPPGATFDPKATGIGALSAARTRSSRYSCETDRNCFLLQEVLDAWQYFVCAAGLKGRPIHRTREGWAPLQSGAVHWGAQIFAPASGPNVSSVTLWEQCATSACGQERSSI